MIEVHDFITSVNKMAFNFQIRESKDKKLLVSKSKVTHKMKIKLTDTAMIYLKKIRSRCIPTFLK
jgi:hypothetical protein